MKQRSVKKKSLKSLTTKHKNVIHNYITAEEYVVYTPRTYKRSRDNTQFILSPTLQDFVVHQQQVQRSPNNIYLNPFTNTTNPSFNPYYFSKKCKKTTKMSDFRRPSEYVFDLNKTHMHSSGSEQLNCQIAIDEILVIPKRAYRRYHNGKSVTETAPACKKKVIKKNIKVTIEHPTKKPTNTVNVLSSSTPQEKLKKEHFLLTRTESLIQLREGDENQIGNEKIIFKRSNDNEFLSKYTSGDEEVPVVLKRSFKKINSKLMMKDGIKVVKKRAIKKTVKKTIQINKKKLGETTTFNYLSDTVNNTKNIKLITKPHHIERNINDKVKFFENKTNSNSGIKKSVHKAVTKNSVSHSINFFESLAKK
ncbi:hypothetical protein QTN25_002516 [Entamoeba marina]